MLNDEEEKNVCLQMDSILLKFHCSKLYGACSLLCEWHSLHMYGAVLKIVCPLIYARFENVHIEEWTGAFLPHHTLTHAE